MAPEVDQTVDDAHARNVITFYGVTPMDVLKWASVIFVVCFQILILVALVFSLIGVFE